MKFKKGQQTHTRKRTIESQNTLEISEEDIKLWTPSLLH